MQLLKQAILKHRNSLTEQQIRSLLRLGVLTDRIATERYFIGLGLEVNLTSSECDYNEIYDLETKNNELLENIIELLNYPQSRIEEVSDLISVEAKQQIELSENKIYSLT